MDRPMDPIESRWREATLSPKQQERADDLTRLVATAVNDLAAEVALGHTQAFLDVLDFFARFHRYSARNLLLIRCQKPDARAVASYTTWQQLGRQVAHGSKAAWIWAPMTRKVTEDGEEREILLGFRPAPVFSDRDLENIDTDPLPSALRPLPDDCEGVYWEMVAAIAKHGITVIESWLPGGVLGKASEKEIQISSQISDSRNRLATLIHEFAHCVAHFGEQVGGKTAQQCEAEAEAACYVAMRALGMDYPFSRDYLVLFRVTPEQLQRSLGAVQWIVRKIMGSVKY